MIVKPFGKKLIGRIWRFLRATVFKKMTGSKKYESSIAKREPRSR
jgi:hypothetical protein